MGQTLLDSMSLTLKKDFLPLGNSNNYESMNRELCNSPYSVVVGRYDLGVKDKSYRLAVTNAQLFSSPGPLCYGKTTSGKE